MDEDICRRERSYSQTYLTTLWLPLLLDRKSLPKYPSCNRESPNLVSFLHLFKTSITMSKAVRLRYSHTSMEPLKLSFFHISIILSKCYKFIVERFLSYCIHEFGKFSQSILSKEWSDKFPVSFPCFTSKNNHNILSKNISKGIAC